jgi:D-alanine-D-alanine ligase
VTVPERIRIAVVFGGRSSEHGVSAVSAGSVLAALDPARYDIIPVGITRGGQWVLADGPMDALRITGRSLPEVESGREVALRGDAAKAEVVVVDPGQAVERLGSVDVVFPVLHGRYGEDGTIQGLLEMAGIPYVGPGVLASAAAMDKEFTKKLLRAEGIPVGAFKVFRRGAGPVLESDVAELGLPLFVKPARSGSSVGISKVRSWAGLAEAVAVAFERDDKILVEAAVPGREIECGVLEDDAGNPEASVPAEIRLVSGHDWYDFEAKYLDDACEFDLPPELPAQVIAEIQDLACRTFVALDCAGLARVDFFVTPAHAVIVNEVNTMPGFTPISMFPRMWQASGVDYPQLIDRLVATALRRAES